MSQHVLQVPFFIFFKVTGSECFHAWVVNVMACQHQSVGNGCRDIVLFCQMRKSGNIDGDNSGFLGWQLFWLEPVVSKMPLYNWGSGSLTLFLALTLYRQTYVFNYYDIVQNFSGNQFVKY
jgi:hypothetical protein